MQLINNTNSNLYMWESEDGIEFENDFIGNTDEVVFNHKRTMSKYESEYYRVPKSPVRRNRRELPPRALQLLMCSTFLTQI